MVIIKTVSGNHVNNTAGNMSLVAYGNTSVFSGNKYSQTCISDYAVASGGNAKFGVSGNLTEDIDGTHTLTSPTAAITYTDGEITVATITHTAHTHVEVPGSGGASSPVPSTQSTSSPEANT